MYKYYCLNQISEVGMEQFTEDYAPAGDPENADAILVRSANMHEMEFGENLKAIARAGAGVNNIPVDACAEKVLLYLIHRVLMPMLLKSRYLQQCFLHREI